MVLKYKENVENYRQWIKSGKSDDDYIEPDRVYTADESEKMNRREQVLAFREHLVSGGDLTKVQIRKFMIAVIDRLM